MKLKKIKTMLYYIFLYLWNQIANELSVSVLAQSTTAFLWSVHSPFTEVTLILSRFSTPNSPSFFLSFTWCHFLFHEQMKLSVESCHTLPPNPSAYLHLCPDFLFLPSLLELLFSYLSTCQLIQTPVLFNITHGSWIILFPFYLTNH